MSLKGKLIVGATYGLIVAGIAGVIGTPNYYDISTNKNNPKNVTRVHQINESLDEIYELLVKKIYETKGLNNNTTINPYIEWSTNKHLDEQNRLQLYKTINSILVNKAKELNVEKDSLEYLITFPVFTAAQEKYEQRKEEIGKNTMYMSIVTGMIFLLLFYGTTAGNKKNRD